LEKYGQRKIADNELLLVSSTSWTKDEDFSVLLDALELYEGSEGKKFIRTFITGKGPEKEKYLKII
jgi:beta-1,4-mannosyltransferase